MTDNNTFNPQNIMQELQDNAREAGFPDVESHWEHMFKDVDMSAFANSPPEQLHPSQHDQSIQPAEPAFDEAAELADLNATYWGFNTADDLKQWGLDVADDRPAQATTDQGVAK